MRDNNIQIPSIKFQIIANTQKLKAFDNRLLALIR